MALIKSILALFPTASTLTPKQGRIVCVSALLVSFASWVVFIYMLASKSYYTTKEPCNGTKATPVFVISTKYYEFDPKDCAYPCETEMHRIHYHVYTQDPAKTWNIIVQCTTAFCKEYQIYKARESFTAYIRNGTLYTTCPCYYDVFHKAHSIAVDMIFAFIPAIVVFAMCVVVASSMYK